MSLMIKVTGNDGNIMEVHKKTADKEGYVWYCYFGNPAAKPYNNKDRLEDVYFIEHEKLYHAELIEIIKGPAQGGIRLEKSMIPYIPKEYQSYIIDDWDNCAFSLKCKNIKQLDFNIIKNIYKEKDDELYNPKIMAAVSYVYANTKPVSSNTNFAHPTKDLIEKALKELGKTKVSRDELLMKLKEIVGRDGGLFVEDEIAWKEINNLNEE